MVAIAANRMAASRDFYSRLFGWQMHVVAPDLTVAMASAGPAISLRSGTPEGFQGVVPFIGVADVDASLADLTAAGATVERAPWSVPMAGKLARFKDASGTIYGLTSAQPPAPLPPMAMPVGPAPKPPPGAICHLEMYAADGEAAGRLFQQVFGWGFAGTMPQYVAFDPGAGAGGIFQSHTPALPAVAYIYTADVGAMLQQVEAGGGRRTAEPMKAPGFATFGYFTDPSGASMGLIGP
jgi:predicted enzyme related to lactoylglutathione lyase